MAELWLKRGHSLMWKPRLVPDRGSGSLIAGTKLKFNLEFGLLVARRSAKMQNTLNVIQLKRDPTDDSDSAGRGVWQPHYITSELGKNGREEKIHINAELNYKCLNVTSATKEHKYQQFVFEL